MSNPTARALGAEDLEPEESVNISAGIATNPFPNFYLTLDFYQIGFNGAYYYAKLSGKLR